MLMHQFRVTTYFVLSDDKGDQVEFEKGDLVSIQGHRILFPAKGENITVTNGAIRAGWLEAVPSKRAEPMTDVYKTAQQAQTVINRETGHHQNTLNVRALLHWWEALVGAPDRILNGLDVSTMTTHVSMAAQAILSYGQIFTDKEQALGPTVVAQRSIGKFVVVFPPKVSKSKGGSSKVRWSNGRWLSEDEKLEHVDLDRICDLMHSQFLETTTSDKK
jgi:hypothetical protein